MSVFLCSCSTYAGKAQPELAKHSCPLRHVICGGEDENFKIRYKVKKLSENNYVIEGFAVFTSTQEFNRYDSVDSMTLKFVFLDKVLAVHEESILVHGVIGKKLSFKKEFTSKKAIDSSTLAEIEAFVDVFG